MIAFPSYLLGIADAAGMKAPETLENTKEAVDAIREQFPHFFVFCQLQIGASMEPDWPSQNAKLIASFPEAAIKDATWTDFYVAGFRIKTPLDLSEEVIAESRARLISWGVLQSPEVQAV